MAERDAERRLCFGALVAIGELHDRNEWRVVWAFVQQGRSTAGSASAPGEVVKLEQRAGCPQPLMRANGSGVRLNALADGGLATWRAQGYSWTSGALLERFVLHEKIDVTSVRTETRSGAGAPSRIPENNATA